MQEKISSFESPITILLSLKKLIAMRKPQVVPVFCQWPHFQFAPFLLVYSGWIQFVPVLIPSHQPLFLICHPFWEIEHARMLVQVTRGFLIAINFFKLNRIVIGDSKLLIFSLSLFCAICIKLNMLLVFNAPYARRITLLPFNNR
jgi:hypothetical protein